MKNMDKTQPKQDQGRKKPEVQSRKKKRPLEKRIQTESASAESEKRYRLLFELSPDAIAIHSGGKLLLVNPAGVRLMGAATRDELIGRQLLDFVHPDFREIVIERTRQQMVENKVVPSMDEKFIRLDGTVIDVDVTAAPFRYQGVPASLVIIRDITERKQAEKTLALQAEELRQRNEELIRLNEQAERRMQRLASMRTIDLAISGSFDVSIVLGIVLDQVTGQLGSHAADILLFSQGAQTFKFACGRGFRTQGLEASTYKFGGDLAGRVIRERRKVEIHDLKAQANTLQRSPDLSGEDFLSYIGMPLVSKGRVRGILEVFHRQPLTLDREWHNYLEMLAGQAAIAIDNAELFDHMQTSNSELVWAYDSTLAGWASALELRALEPEGHSRRVDNLSARLAQDLGLNDKDLVHIHRGALLHDLGMMGVPDSIMLKPGPLTEAEWEVMRRHPKVAINVLSPITYLRPALDIPYYHHEKWDGTGYPHGLKRENIPLAARIFAVVDVWDVLTSDRPYRKAWPEMEALGHIRQQAGLHFDPLVVKAFLGLSANKRHRVSSQ